MSVLRSVQLIGYATNEYVAGRIEVDELEDRIERALTGEATDEEWISAARSARDRRSPQSLATVDSLLKSVYRGPIRGENINAKR